MSKRSDGPRPRQRDAVTRADAAGGWRLNRVAALLIASIAVLLVAADFVLIEFFGSFIVIPVVLLPSGLIGPLLIYRLPRNVVGWLLGTSGVFFQVAFTSGAYSWVALVASPGRFPGGEVVAAISSASFAPALGCTIIMLLFFPSGRGLGGRWTWVGRGLIAVVVLAGVGGLFNDPLQLSTPFTATPPDGPALIPNPLVPYGPLAGVFQFLVLFSGPGTVPVMLAGPIALIVRYRRSAAVEREQIKWLAYSGSLAAVSTVASSFAAGDLAIWLSGLGAVGWGLIPIAIAIAIFRYRLYGIDVLIRRTLIYAAVSGVLAAAYVGAVALSQAVLARFTAGSSVAVAISTLAVVALFQPVRSRIRSAVDRRFYRSKYDAERTLDAFAARCREEVDLDALERELLGVVSETIQPVQASVWLRR